MTKIQKSWTESSERGFRELSRRRPEEAARWWLDADASSAGNDEADDPLRAAIRSNAGAARLLLGHGHEAAACFDAAERSWRKVVAGIASMNVPMTGASSSFHFRLAASAPQSLTDARRTRYRRLAEAALGITEFNRAFADLRKFSDAAISERASALQPPLSEILGKASPEVRLLSSCVRPHPPSEVFAIYADKFAAIASRQETYAAVLSSECAKIECALALTALLALPLFAPVLRPRGEETDDSTNLRNLHARA